MQSASAADVKRGMEASHQALRTELEKRHFSVTGSASSLVNAVFVAAPANRLSELKSLPGVVSVVRLHKYRQKLNKAVQLINGANAWNLSGSFANAGSGIKIAILTAV